MAKKSLKTNAVLSAIRVSLNIIFPLVTFPYVSRILGVDNLGKVNYTGSIVNYFSLIAALGISTYAVREGAKIRDNRKKFEIFSKEIFSINLFTTIIAYIMLIFACLNIHKLQDYKLLIFLQSGSILFNTIGVEWVNTIYEDYIYIVIRSFFVQLISLICMFVFVHAPDDYYTYVGITVIANAVVEILNVCYVKKYCKIGFTFHLNIKQHIKPIVLFFANSLAINVYLSADMTMLGWISGNYYSGIYAVSVKIYTIIKTLLNSIYSVAIPRLALYQEQKLEIEYRKTLTDIMCYMVILSFPAAAFLGGLADNAILIVSGQNYIEATLSLQILSISLLFAITGGVFVTCLNATLNREAISLIATLIAAVANIILNAVLIPLFKQNGAAMTTAIAELIVVMYCYFLVKNINRYFIVREIVKQLIWAMVGYIEILVICFAVKLVINNIILSSFIAILIGSTLYLGMLILTKNKYIFNIISELIRHK